MAGPVTDAMVENKASETWVSIPEDEQTAAGLNFGDKTIRRGFIREISNILILSVHQSQFILMP